MSDPITLGVVEGYKCVTGTFEENHWAPIAPVHGVMAFPLPAGSKPGCLHIGGAINWGAMRLAHDPETNALRYLFQLLMLALEDTSIGTPYFKPEVLEDVDSLDSLDMKIVHKGKLLTTCFEKASAAVEGTQIFKPQTAYPLSTIYKMSDRLVPFDPNSPYQSTMPHAEPVATVRGPRISVVDPGDHPSAAPDATRARSAASERGAGGAGPNAMMREQVMEDDEDADFESMFAQQLMDAAAAAPGPTVTPSAPTPADDDPFGNVDMEDVFAGGLDTGGEPHNRAGTGAPAVPPNLAAIPVPQLPVNKPLPKFVIQVVPLFRGGSGERGGENLGSIMYVLLLDPNANVGHAFENLFDFQASSPSTGSARCYRLPGRIDPTAAMRKRFDTVKGGVDRDHAIHHLSPLEYSRSVQVYMNQCLKNRHGREGRLYREKYNGPESKTHVAAGDFRKFNNPFNPMHVFSVKNALAYMEQLHTVNMSSYCASNFVHPSTRDPGHAQVWSFLESPQPACLYQPSDFRWYTPQFIGLSGQLLPWIHDIYREFSKIVRPIPLLPPRPPAHAQLTA